MADTKNNTGIENTGDRNSGNWNSGDRNSGNWNPGNWNSGDWNSGNGNSGNWNPGNWNPGNWNSGDRNSGDWNSGNGNSGNRNSGNGNSGNRNSGNWNSGYGNSTNRESGIFCSEQGTIRMFNQDSGKTWDEISHPHFGEFYLTKWISESDMTDEEKKADPEFYVRGGYLKRFEYKDAWASFWRDTDEDNRKKFLALPNFNARIFEEITGVNTDQPSMTISDDALLAEVRKRGLVKSGEIVK